MMTPEEKKECDERHFRTFNTYQFSYEAYLYALEKFLTKINKEREQNGENEFIYFYPEEEHFTYSEDIVHKYEYRYEDKKTGNRFYVNLFKREDREDFKRDLLEIYENKEKIKTNKAINLGDFTVIQHIGGLGNYLRIKKDYKTLQGAINLQRKIERAMEEQAKNNIFIFENKVMYGYLPLIKTFMRDYQNYKGGMLFKDEKKLEIKEQMVAIINMELHSETGDVAKPGSLIVELKLGYPYDEFEEIEKETKAITCIK